MKQNVKSVAVLVSICAVIGLLLAATNAITAPIIEKNAAAAATEGLLKVMPDGTGFEEMDLTQYALPSTVTKAYKEASGKGYVLELTTTGYQSGLKLMCGVSTDGIITGAVCLESNETWGLEKTLGEQMTGKDATTVVDVEAGATSKTINGYRAAMVDALNAAINLSGGNVDIRTEEQILADNLAAALPAGEGKFTKWFATEEITGVSAVYTADNGAGYVCVIGEQFIGADASGASDNAAVAAAVKAVTASTLTDVAFADKGLNENITSVKKTATGNYVIEINGLGFGYFGDDHAYQPAKNIPMVIRVSITPAGKIIDCLTVSHQESQGYGAAWGTEEYYGQFNGKTLDTYQTVDTVAGATISNNGYMKAIERCLQAVTILEGGAK